MTVFSLGISAALLIGSAPLCAFAETSGLGRSLLVSVSLMEGLFLLSLLIVIVITAATIRSKETE